MKGAMVEKLMRDAKLTQIFEGTNQINRIVSGRGVLTGKSVLF
jgi:alkylation response protein AidB-like acyl-CoA dehydrogenase